MRTREIGYQRPGYVVTAPSIKPWHFLPHPFQYICSWQSHHRTLCNIRSWPGYLSRYRNQATGSKVRSSNHGRRRFFHLQTRSDRPSRPSIFHCNVYLSLPGLKWRERDADNTPLSIAEDNVEYSQTSPPYLVFMACTENVKAFDINRQ